MVSVLPFYTIFYLLIVIFLFYDSTSTQGSHPMMNKFSNDGSFFEQFKKLTERQKGKVWLTLFQLELSCSLENLSGFHLLRVH